MTGTVLIVRHGATPWTEAGRVQGWAPVPLSDRGRRQAEALRDHLSKTRSLDRIVTSDLRRSERTAATIAGAFPEVDLERDRRWRERDFGVLQGISDDQYHGEFGQFSVGSTGEQALSNAPEKGETWYDVAERVERAWTDVRDAVGDGTTAVVTHTIPMLALLAHLQDRPLLDPVDGSIDTASVSEIRIGDGKDRDQETVVTVGRTDHLDEHRP